MYLVDNTLVVILAITSTTVAYRDGAQNDSCYNHYVNHVTTFNVTAQGRNCADPCNEFTLTVVNKLGEETIQNISSYECNQIYLLNINYSNNAFEGFLVQARDVSGIFNETSSIYGTFIENSSFLYKPLMCGMNVNDETVLYPNSATQRDLVDLETHVPLYWRAPDPVTDNNLQPPPPYLTFWFTIVQQLQTFYFPIEGPTLARDDSSCIFQPPTTTAAEASTSGTTGSNVDTFPTLCFGVSIVTTILFSFVQFLGVDL